ncbi:hypothetical protein AMATHDRAFT_144896 [Amanita thiersii Skay4041]|uniref:Oxidoreductase AflY n=1 Tax=Amanita thiersii Skay4041 TaxID=703135 RepID=A0A2A9NRY2_9AGAR|nr:hypothetical protein AMATHDRAFT_144896 [Amanita thiersii Skay4041]
MNVTSTLKRTGVLNLPVANHASKCLVETLLAKDANEHHCYFRSAGLHNHLSHHLLAAYDLGAAPNLLRKIYDKEAAYQRPIYVEEKDRDIVITENNWTKHLGNQHAYGAYLKFFTERISHIGVHRTFEQYLFDKTANDNGVNMLIRLVSGAVHPFIHVGYGIEFESDLIIAAGLAQAAIHVPQTPEIFDLGAEAETAGDTTNGLTLLEILREVYDSDILKPVMPYDPNALVNARLKAAVSEGREEEIKRMCSKFVVDATLSSAEFDAKIQECFWTATLLLCATGRQGREPRLDFFLMHLVTSSLFLPSYFRFLQNPSHKASLLKAYIPVMLLYILARGRPRIDPDLLMSYKSTPRPPVHLGLAAGKGAIGDPNNDLNYNPWPPIVGSVLHAPDSHVLKAIRSLIYAAKKYGDVPPGGAIGSFKTVSGTDTKTETHKGTAKMDGTIFVRAAGMVLDYMGWVGHGQAARDDWDRSALGWDDAWN